MKKRFLYYRVFIKYVLGNVAMIALLVSAFFVPFSQVSAARDIISATLNGVSSASVKKSEMVNASVTVESKNLGNWASICILKQRTTPAI